MKKSKLLLITLLAIFSSIFFQIDTYAAETKVNEINIYHQHSGNTSSGGLCYTPVYHTHTSSCYQTVDAQINERNDPIVTDACGCRHQRHYARCTVCNSLKTGQTNVSTNCTQGHSLADEVVPKCHTKKVIVCGKDTSTIERYNFTCTKSTSIVIGNIDMYKISGLSYKLQIKSTSATITSYTWNTGASTSSIEITGNGTYTCNITYNIENRTETTTLSYQVTDYDITAPTFDISVDYADMVNDTVAVSIINIVEEGVGLHDTPYSYDGGNTWTTNNKAYLYGQGTYQICVRDKCLNLSSETVSLNCLMKANVSVLNTDIATVQNELSPVTFKIAMHNYTSYSYVRQQKDEATPKNNEWEVIEPDNTVYSENILVTSSINNGFKSRTTLLTVNDTNADDYWYGVIVKKQTDSGTTIQTPIYAYNDIHINTISVTELNSSVEAGDIVTLDDFIIMANYNDNQKVIINNIDKYNTNLHFENGNNFIKPVTIGHLSSDIILSYNSVEYRGAYVLNIVDTTKPTINDISIINYEIVGSIQPKNFTVVIEAEDNSDSTLMYAINEIGSTSTPIYTVNNNINKTFRENTYINVYVKDGAGNVSKMTYYVCFVDLNPPEVNKVTISPDINISSTKYEVNVNASDDCASSDELLYKFVLDGVVIQDYSNIATCTVTKNGSLKIYVKDKTGKITEYSNPIDIKYADTNKPVISDIKIRVSLNYIIATIEAIDDITKELTYGCMSYAGNISQKENFFTILQTGDHTFYAVDDAGNKSEKVVHIDIAELTENSLLYSIVGNISVKALGNTYECNGEIFTNKGYELSVSYKDDIETSKVLTAIDDEEYENKFLHTITKNGSYVLNSRYTAEESAYTGPIVYKNTISINGIDQVAPTISVKKTDNIVTINAKDDMSGIAKIVVASNNEDGMTSEREFVYGNLQSSASQSITADNDKVYQIYCYDNVGNKSNIIAISSAGVLESDEELKVYKVVFISEMGGILKIQQVIKGYPAVAPTVPSKNGFKFVSWSESFSSVNKNMYIYPIYEKMETSAEIIPHYDEALRYNLVVNPFAFSSQNSGKTITPLDKVSLVSPYDKELYEFKKDTYSSQNDVITSKIPATKEEKSLQKISISNPVVMVPLLFLLSVVIIVHLVKRKKTKEY